jgi:4-amino-4-deoxy-L-arabinose transferase-like glycosyltransferase
MMQMVFVEYGVDRFVPHPWRGQHRVAVAQRAANGGAGSPALSGMAADRVPIGPLRLADPHLGGQVGWFFPLAAFGLAAFAVGRGRNLETPDIALWTGWALTYAAVFSFAGGIFHAYYLVAIAPPVAALTGIGIVALWAQYRHGGGTAWLLPAALAATGLWQAWLDHEAIGTGLDDWRTALFALLLVGTAMGACGLIVAWRRNLPRFALVSLCLGLVAASAIPLAWAVSTVLGESNVSFPAADIALLAPASERSERLVRAQRWTRNAHLDDDRLLTYLRENRGSAEFLLATQTTQQAAPIILKTGAPVMAAGGYSGSDPIVTPDSLGALVAAGRVRFFLIREGGRGGGGGNPDGQFRQIADWVKSHGQLVDPKLWRAFDAQAQQGQFALYDLYNRTAARN